MAQYFFMDSSRLPSTLGFGVSKKPSLGGVFHRKKLAIIWQGRRRPAASKKDDAESEDEGSAPSDAWKLQPKVCWFVVVQRVSQLDFKA